MDKNRMMELLNEIVNYVQIGKDIPEIIDKLFGYGIYEGGINWIFWLWWMWFSIMVYRAKEQNNEMLQKLSYE